MPSFIGANLPNVKVYSGSGSANATENSTTYTTELNSGTGISFTVPVESGYKLLVCLTTVMSVNANDRLGYMSFSATSTGSAGITVTPADTFSVSNGGKTLSGVSMGGNTAIYYFEPTGAGDITFTANYRVSSGTLTLAKHEIVVIVIS